MNGRIVASFSHYLQQAMELSFENRDWLQLTNTALRLFQLVRFMDDRKTDRKPGY